MSGDTRVTGEIRIDPPITWGELHAEPWATDGNRDAVVKIKAEDENTPEGVLTRRRGVAIVASYQEQSAYQLTEHVQAIVDRFRRPPDRTTFRTFTGQLDCVFAGGEEIWRVAVVGDRAVRETPIMVWPSGASALPLDFHPYGRLWPYQRRGEELLNLRLDGISHAVNTSLDRHQAEQLGLALLAWARRPQPGGAR